MPEGVIAGGWEYVIAAYGITAIVLIGFSIRLISRLRIGGGDDES